jgi:sugar lactone lactonase YvrE
MYGLFSGCSDSGPEVHLVLDTRSSLGEGAIWNHETQQLYWVDITGKIFHRYHPETGIHKEFLTGQMIGTIVPTDSGAAVAALKKGIYRIDIDTGSKQLLADPEPDVPGNRFNDGKCDPSGRLWAGTMSLTGESGKGALYRIDGKGTTVKMIHPVSISNGITWSNDHTRMYYIDTPTQKVVCYDYNPSTGEIRNPRVVVNIPEESGSPDGMTIDTRGNLWIALWGGYAVTCWNPESGELIRKIEVPAKNVSSCAFGDSDLKTLYITTARENLDARELEQYPFSGGLFKIRPGATGVPASFFKETL